MEPAPCRPNGARQKGREHNPMAPAPLGGKGGVCAPLLTRPILPPVSHTVEDKKAKGAPQPRRQPSHNAFYYPRCCRLA